MNAIHVEIFEEARELISVPERGTQHSVARDNESNSVRFDSPRAVCWCIAGALALTSHKNGVKLTGPIASILREVQNILESLEPGTNAWIGFFNDTHTHAQALQLLDKAIKLAKTE